MFIVRATSGIGRLIVLSLRCCAQRALSDRIVPHSIMVSFLGSLSVVTYEVWCRARVSSLACNSGSGASHAENVQLVQQNYGVMVFLTSFHGV